MRPAKPRKRFVYASSKRETAGKRRAGVESEISIEPTNGVHARQVIHPKQGVRYNIPRRKGAFQIASATLPPLAVAKRVRQAKSCGKMCLFAALANACFELAPVALKANAARIKQVCNSSDGLVLVAAAATHKHDQITQA